MYLYLEDAKRILRKGGLFHFDSLTLSTATRDLFKQAVAEYKYDPSQIRGLLSFNQKNLVKNIIDEVGFEISNKSIWGDWMRILVRKR
jgi:hypothetical protein